MNLLHKLLGFGSLAVFLEGASTSSNNCEDVAIDRTLDDGFVCLFLSHGMFLRGEC